MNKIKALPNRVLIFATSRNGLLVFEEPDFPEVPFQVPGGMISKNETPLMAAKREFAEKTGITHQSKMHHLGFDQHQVQHDDRVCLIERYHFHARLSDETPTAWDHRRNFANDRSKPILLRFSWISLDRAIPTLNLKAGDVIDALHKRHSAAL